MLVDLVESPPLGGIMARSSLAGGFHVSVDLVEALSKVDDHTVVPNASGSAASFFFPAGAGGAGPDPAGPAAGRRGPLAARARDKL